MNKNGLTLMHNSVFKWLKNIFHKNKALRHYVFNFLDILILIAVFLGSFQIFNAFTAQSLEFSREYYYLLLAMVPTWLILNQILNISKFPRINNYVSLFIDFAKFAMIDLAFMYFYIVLIRLKSVDLIFPLIYSLFGMIILFTFRLFTFKVFKYFRSNGHNIRNVIIIADDSSRDVINKILDHKEWGYRILMIATSSQAIRNEFSDRVRITTDRINLKSLIEIDIIDEVLYSKSKADQSQLKGMMNSCDEIGVVFRINSHVTPVTPSKAQTEYIENIPFLTFTNTTYNNFGLAVKTVMDTMISFFILLGAAPVMLFVSAMIKLTSKGPVFFKQERVGLRGRKFYIYKFRTMVTNAEELKKKLMDKNESDGPVFKIKNDPRITSIGKFLRKTNLDELPQLINVLKGEMSLVGPRPPIPSEVSQYERWQLKRLAMKPGITCTWQIMPRRNEIRFERWMKLDIQYIENWSIKKDLILFFKTIKTVISAESY